MADENTGGTPSPTPTSGTPSPSPAPSPAPSPSPTEGAKKTLATGANNEGAAGDNKPAFGDNWRKELAGDDDKALKRLERFSSPKDIVTSYLELEKKKSEGFQKPTLPKDATPEQLAAYRTEIGVPDAPEKYDLTLPDGLVPGEADKPLIDSYLKYAFENNLPNDVVKANLAWYLPMEKEMEIQQQEADKDYQVNSEEVMRNEWGTDFKANINLISGMLETVPQEVADLLMFGRTMDGKIIGDDPRMLKLISNWAREINPVQTVVPNAGSNAPQVIADELASLTKLSGDKNSEYWSKDKGPAMQQRMRDLLEAQERIKTKAA